MSTTKEKIAIMQAFEDGKEIEVFHEWDVLNNCPLAEKWVSAPSPRWDWVNNDYRIKPEAPKSTHRPYESVEELIDDYCDKSGELRLARLSMPYIWVKFKDKRWGDTTHLLSSFNNACEGHSYVWIANGWVSFEELFDEYTYLDGSPCGKLVE